MSFFDELEALVCGSQPGSTAADILANMGIPSVSVAVLDNGDISSRCFSSVGDDTDTIFQACSISKAITALGVMKLVEQGVWTLDQCVKELLPGDVLDILTEDEAPGRKALIEGITIRQLMSHTSGLSVEGFPGYSVLNGETTVTAKDVIGGKYPANTMRVRLEAFPGLAFSYAGGGITVLQVLMETITGKQFPALMQDLVLDPLRMTRTHYRFLAAEEKNWARCYYTGYTPCEDSQRVLPERAAGGMWTTPKDLLKAFLAVQDSLDGDGGFLKQATAKEMLTEVDSRVALSWFLPGSDDILFGHSGSNVPGYLCLAEGFANIQGGDKGFEVPRRSGMVVMTNSVEGDSAITRMFLAISYLKKWPAAIVRRKVYIPFALCEADPGAAWKRWVGSWTNERYRFALVDGENGRPAIKFNHLAPVRLFPTAAPNTTFDDGGGFCEFAIDGMEMLVRLKVDQDKEVLQVCDGRTDKVLDLGRES